MGGLVLAVVAGTLLWRSMGSDEGSEDLDANRAPFYLAVYNLAREPVAHYTGSAPDGTARDLTVTDADEGHGWITASGSRIPVLMVGGKTYVKPPRDMLTNVPNGPSA
ncbi:hypothetical protein ACFYV5_11300 [Streptomyces sp. NPDC003035]|uniref:hypothetical protein n=1 Tax=Streptomyces sp. NPDC003035 TaxID=3364676 RepID=UPI0036A0DA10